MTYIKVIFFMPVILVLGFLTNAYGQKESKNIDFVLLINEDVYNQYAKFKLIKYHNGKEEDVLATYWPGNLSIPIADYEKLLNENADSIFLSINDDRYIDGKESHDQYIIEYKKQWLEDTYNILRVYNLDKKKYAKLFNHTLKGKNYVYELDSPCHTFRLVRKTSNYK
ncbi:hypothetical protein SAMN05518672_102256 [Chitinophaga sp. CF118]|uniref:hypothetical protein n=1 Tax=Chitinophaga sp. CF118 TaxID=1884367 RepID=UPI0008EFABB9|nr:hypothetical protein [Chitinophaga sp. CF118]SFD51474.1 hypothetical protein SAMN05518672_102256 [Chitinophaga sp. CF118]